MTLEEMQAIKKELVDCCQRVYAKGYVAANDGNLSVRLDTGAILATPTGMSKGSVTEADLVVVDREGRVVEGTRSPSTELQMHRRIYDIRPDVMAVVHAHPVYATGFATANIPLDRCVLAEIVTTLGSVPLASYGTPSTSELPDSISEVLRTANACLLANHGVVTCGNDIFDAYYKMERVEHYAHIIFIARMLGGEKTLTATQVHRLRGLRSTYGTESSPDPGCTVCDKDCVGDDCTSYAGDHLGDRTADIVRDVIRRAGLV